MRNFNIETSLPFPLIEMTELVTSTEVKKPSGVQYMILVLLKESKDKNQYLASLLKSFGVPEELHDIYAEEINRLLESKILVCDKDYSKFHFSTYKLLNFSFTPFGNKVFAEEQINTGKEKETKIKCFYDIACNQLVLKPSSELEAKILSDGAFNEEFIKQFKCKKNVEEFFNTLKGPSFQIKAAEVITKIELYEEKYYVGKYDANLYVDCDSIKINLKHKLAQEFFDNYYTSDIFNKAIELNNKFKLDNYNDAKLSEFNYDEIYQVKIPSDYQQILDKKYSFVLARDKYKMNQQNKIVVDVSSIDAISKYANFVCIDNSSVFAYCPVRLELIDNKLGKIYLPVVIVLKPSIELFSQAIGNYIDSINKYSFDNFKEIISICNVTKYYNKVIEKLKSFMSNHEDDNLTLLNEVKPLVFSNTSLLFEYKKIVKTIYDNYMSTIKEDSIDSYLKITSFVPKLLDIKNSEIIEKIFSIIPKPKKIIPFYETLIQYFNKELVLNYINPFEEVLKTKNASDKQLLNILTFVDSLVNLKKITKINDSVKYSFDEEDVNKQEFKKVYITACDSYESIKVFKQYNQNYFSLVEEYMDIFKKINDNLNMLDQATKNPKNITTKLIDKEISLGHYQFVFINLAAKLELLLNEKFNLEGTLAEKLKQAKKEKYLNKDVISDLHDFKEVRNSLVHPQNSKIKYDVEDIRRWSKEIFEIEELKNESSNKG